MKQLIKIDDNVHTAFRDYLLKLGLPVEQIAGFLNTSNDYRLCGYILDFLSKKKVYVIAGHNYVVAYRLLENNKQHIIEAVQVKDKEYMEVLKVGIYHAVRHLVKPF